MRKWNRKILSVYGAVVLLSMLSALLRAFVFPHADNSFPLAKLLPFFLCALLLAGTEWAYHRGRHLHPVLILAVGIAVSLLIIPFDATPGNPIYYAYLPVLLSVFYFRKTYTLLAAGGSSVAFSLLYTFHPALRGQYHIQNLIGNLIAFFVGLTILLLLIDRVKQLLEDLAGAQEAKRELMVRSILMDKLVKTDPLTGLYTHTSFHNYLEELIGQNKRIPFSIHLAVLDVDDFKKFNDTYGHRLGDIVLTEVSRLILKRIGPDDFAARCGGEEFAILFLEKKPEQVHATIEKIRKRISEISIAGHPELKVSVSIGLQEYESSMTKDQFFKEADDSMYLAKEAGKNRIVWRCPRRPAPSSPPAP